MNIDELFGQRREHRGPSIHLRDLPGIDRCQVELSDAQLILVLGRIGEVDDEPVLLGELNGDGKEPIVL